MQVSEVNVLHSLLGTILSVHGDFTEQIGRTPAKFRAPVVLRRTDRGSCLWGVQDVPRLLAHTSLFRDCGRLGRV